MSGGGLPDRWRGARHSALDELATHIDLAALALPNAAATRIEEIALSTWEGWLLDRQLPWTGRVAAELEA